MKGYLKAPITPKIQPKSDFEINLIDRALFSPKPNQAKSQLAQKVLPYEIKNQKEAATPSQVRNILYQIRKGQLKEQQFSGKSKRIPLAKTLMGNWD